jgi:hypothetical protein
LKNKNSPLISKKPQKALFFKVFSLWITCEFRLRAHLYNKTTLMKVNVTIDKTWKLLTKARAALIWISAIHFSHV